MARILISESHPQVQRMLTRMLARLGHEPVVASTPMIQEGLQSIDLLLVEPADTASAQLARTSQLTDPLLPIICVSVLASPQIDVVFSACLHKPFFADDLATAINHALAQQPRASRNEQTTLQVPAHKDPV
jgi:CheY-like chemotaxis protein